MEAEGIEGGEGPHDDLRGPATIEQHREVAREPGQRDGSSAEGAVTERVTVPVGVLRELAELARRTDPEHPALTELERYLAGASR